MVQTDLFSFLDAGIRKLNFAGDFDLTWQKKERTFTIEITFYAENSSQSQIADVQGVVSNEPFITFVDAILLFDETREQYIEEDEYLVCLPFNGKQGWSLAQGKAFFSYLQEILDVGQSNLLDFLNEPAADIFELVFDKEKFATLIAQNSETERLVYPKF
ncbi:DUF3013 family protein [Ligilactobacillus sp. WILCCON 0076]|uniref:DUF3013 family protein n=1 Tax=Ligilactobacillus ubinensis TaxID=2876789 RepID=A0A9X2FLL5_9LACO|nr:DUF3013 family protein [Ligilactobacillus ubinensis]MCP0887807.1 DUF3013 family protein [Ligilactobacillus ubinensis]